MFTFKASTQAPPDELTYQTCVRLLRMTLAAMVSYLETNRLTWRCDGVEETAMVLRAAAKEEREDEWEAWAVGNVGKKE